MNNKEAAIEWFSMLKEKFVKTEYEDYLDMAIAAMEFRERYDNFWEEVKAHYQRGLSDAWEAARKIVLPGDVSGIYLADLEEIFDRSSLQDVIKDYSASECIEKIRKYERGKEEIKVGDEVNAPFGKAIVVNIDSVAKKIWLVYADGHGGFEYFKDAPTKTGRHFPEIAAVLEKMRE